MSRFFLLAGISIFRTILSNFEKFIQVFIVLNIYIHALDIMSSYLNLNSESILCEYIGEYWIQLKQLKQLNWLTMTNWHNWIMYCKLMLETKTMPAVRRTPPRPIIRSASHMGMSHNLAMKQCISWNNLAVKFSGMTIWLNWLTWDNSMIWELHTLCILC